MTFKTAILTSSCAMLLAGCATKVDPNANYPRVSAFAETVAVSSQGDAADDPAVWVNSSDPSASRILGTDKKAGLYVYDLSGAVLQFLPLGNLNNVDLRQGVSFNGAESIDLAAATNRSINGVTLFTIDASGKVETAGEFLTPTVEPYGLCVGNDENGYRVFVTYKTGEIEIFEITAGKDSYEADLVNTLKLESQLEGCVYDELQNVIFVGEEEAGLWRIDLDGNQEFIRTSIDTVGSVTGLVADVEGVALWNGPANTGYLVASAQSGDRFVIYERAAPNRWVGTFTIGDSPDGLIDGVSHTDGIAVSSANLGELAPNGIFVAQDDANDVESATQNFKFVSWADIETVMKHSPEN